MGDFSSKKADIAQKNKVKIVTCHLKITKTEIIFLKIPVIFMSLVHIFDRTVCHYKTYTNAYKQSQTHTFISFIYSIQIPVQKRKNIAMKLFFLIFQKNI